MKDALPGTGRGGSTTGQGYGQEGRGLTSGTGTGKPYCSARKGQDLLHFSLGSTAWNHAVQLDAALVALLFPYCIRTSAPLLLVQTWLPQPGCLKVTHNAQTFVITGFDLPLLRLVQVALAATAQAATAALPASS